MKKIKLVLSVVSVFCGILFTQAQQNQIDPKIKAIERKQTLTKQLSLSEEQGNKVYDATFKFWTDALKVQQADHSPQEARELNKAIKEEFESSLKATLTEDQYNKLLKIREQMAERQKNKNKQ